MNYRYLRLIGLLGQALFCLFIFVAGLITEILFFCTFIGPAGILIFIALHPNYYFDFIAVTTIILMVILSLIFSFAVAIFNESYLVALVTSLTPMGCLAAVLKSMMNLRKIDPSYT